MPPNHDPKWSPPDHREWVGEFVKLLPLQPEQHCAELFPLSHGNSEREELWRFLFYGPFESAQAMEDWYAGNLTAEQGVLAWAVHSVEQGRLVGITTFLNIVPAHGRAEIGHIWFAPEVRRTRVNTESQFLLLKHLFDTKHYRRAEWKCDSLNHASRTAATRLGFTFEGRFRQHMVIKGKNRDTDWFAMTDKDWPLRRANFERWLYSGEAVSLMEMNSGL